MSAVRVDVAPLVPGAVVVGVRGLGVLGATVLLASGGPGREPSVMRSAVTAGLEGNEFRVRVTGYPAGGVLDMAEDGSYTYVGPDGVLSFERFMDGVSLGAGSVPLGDLVDTERPVLTGAITPLSVTHNRIDVSCPVATDNTGVTAYDWSRNGGATWTAGSNAFSFTGLAPDTSYELSVRARDAAGNVSSPALALTVVTSSLVIAPWVFTSELRAVHVTSDAYGLLGKFVKQPSEALDYRFDFTEWLRDCQDTIADKQVVAFGDGALQVTQVDQLDGSVAALVAGGVNGKTYKLTCTITTAGGRKKEADIQIRIKES